MKFCRFIYCQCGCQKTLPRNNKWGATNKLIKGHTFKGKNHWNWNNGIRKHDGYIQIYLPTHPFAQNKGYVPKHRLVMEKHIGRYLTKNELVHHINGIKDDNRIDNLQIVSPSEHTLIHNYERTQRKLNQIGNETGIISNKTSYSIKK